MLAGDFEAFVPEAVITLLIAAMFPDGLRQVGWRRDRWGINILLGVLLFVSFWLVGSGLNYLGMFFFPAWVARLGSGSPLFHGILQHTLLGNLAGFILLFLNSVAEDTFDIFLFIRLRQCFKGRLLVPFVVVILIDAVSHFEFGFPTSIAAMSHTLTVSTFVFLKLVVFYYTRHIGALVTWHTLHNFSLDIHRYIVADLEWILRGGR